MSDTGVMASGSPTQLAQLLSHVLGGVAKRTGSAVALTAVWREIVGQVIASHCQLRELQAGRLVIICDAVQWKLELENRRSTLLAEFRERLGANSVTSLSFEVA